MQLWQEIRSEDEVHAGEENYRGSKFSPFGGKGELFAPKWLPLYFSLIYIFSKSGRPSGVFQKMDGSGALCAEPLVRHGDLRLSKQGGKPDRRRISDTDGIRKSGRRLWHSELNLNTWAIVRFPSIIIGGDSSNRIQILLRISPPRRKGGYEIRPIGELWKRSS